MNVICHIQRTPCQCEGAEIDVNEPVTFAIQSFLSRNNELLEGCFCEGCLKGKTCLNISYVTPYKETRLSISLRDAPQKMDTRMYQPHL